MAYKQKDQSIISGTSAHKSALKKAAAEKSAMKWQWPWQTSPPPNNQGGGGGGGNQSRDWDAKDMKKAAQGQGSGKSLNELVAMRKKETKNSNQWKKIQNAINEQMGVKKRYDIDPDVVKTDKKGRKRSESTTDLRGATDTVKYDKKGRKRKEIDQMNRSTYDAATQTGESGLGMQTTTRKYNKKGERKGKIKTRYSMGTDTKKDDKRTASKIGKRKQKIRTVAPSKGKRGTVTREKDYTKGRKAGTSVTKVRQKGKLFGKGGLIGNKKVDVDLT